MNINTIKKSIAFLPILSVCGISFGQSQTAPTSTASSMDPHLILAIVAALLVIPIVMLGRALVEVVRSKMTQKKEGTIHTILLILVPAIAFQSNAQAQDVKAKVVEKSGWITSLTGTEWLLIITILIELIVIFYLSAKINSFIKTATVPIEKAPNKWWEALKTKFSNMWSKMNNFRPIAEEKNLDTGHNYDGIRELNNVTPAWFTTAFILSIIFSVIYLWRYHVSNTAPLQIEEYQIAMAKADKEQLEYLKTVADKIDETNIKIADAAGIADGKLYFKTNCAQCHAENGGGNSGPNLTDDYWIHGGSLPDIFKSIKYGWQDKGMKSWKDELSAKQMAQIASYVKSLKGTNPAGGKAPEGDLYNEAAAVADSTNTNKKIDTVSKK